MGYTQNGGRRLPRKVGNKSPNSRASYSRRLIFVKYSGKFSTDTTDKFVDNLKVALWGFLNTAAVRPIVFLLPTSSRIHLNRRHASYRCAGPLPAEAGTITNEFC